MHSTGITIVRIFTHGSVLKASDVVDQISAAAVAHHIEAAFA